MRVPQSPSLAPARSPTLSRSGLRETSKRRRCFRPPREARARQRRNQLAAPGTGSIKDLNTQSMRQRLQGPTEVNGPG